MNAPAPARMVHKQVNQARRALSLR